MLGIPAFIDKATNAGTSDDAAITAFVDMRASIRGVIKADSSMTAGTRSTLFSILDETRDKLGTAGIVVEDVGGSAVWKRM